jgi:hypothetical protein
VHPTTDGSHHVPAVGTNNANKVLRAGAVAGSEVWGPVAYSELTGAPTALPASGGNSTTVGGRTIYSSAGNPSGGVDGDIWFQYT